MERYVGLSNLTRQPDGILDELPTILPDPPGATGPKRALGR